MRINVLSAKFWTHMVLTNHLHLVPNVYQKETESVLNRRTFQRCIDHGWGAFLQEVVDDPSGNKMLLVMDYMEGGPVMTREALERGRCIPESLACQYFRDMCKVSTCKPITLSLYFFAPSSTALHSKMAEMARKSYDIRMQRERC